MTKNINIYSSVFHLTSSYFLATPLVLKLHLCLLNKLLRDGGKVLEEGRSLSILILNRRRQEPAQRHLRVGGSLSPVLILLAITELSPLNHLWLGLPAFVDPCPHSWASVAWSQCKFTRSSPAFALMHAIF